MPDTPEKTYDLGDFADLLEALNAEGFQFAVIGGIAVGTYARLAGQRVFSGDLDLYAELDTVYAILRWAGRNGCEIIRRPKVRSLQLAMFDWRGKRVDILGEARGMRPPAEVIASSREVLLGDSDIDVPVADPLHLLENKLAVGRDKDLPHIDVLRAFAVEEAVAAFVNETNGRRKIAPIRRLMAVTGDTALDENLMRRLTPLASEPACFRFLVSVAPSAESADAVVAARAGGRPGRARSHP